MILRVHIKHWLRYVTVPVPKIFLALSLHDLYYVSAQPTQQKQKRWPCAPKRIKESARETHVKRYSTLVKRSATLVKCNILF